MMEYLKLVLFRRKWRRKNQHNETYIKQQVNDSLIEVGRGTYGLIDVQMFNDTNRLIIGDFCSIGPNTMFILSSEHKLDTLSTYPFKVKYFGEKNEALSKGDIVVGDDVWIGCNVTIMSGVHIGQGAVLAAGAVITHDVPAYSVVAGVPAKVIKYRFPEQIRKKLEKLDYSCLTDEMIRNNKEHLYETISDISQLNWIVKEKGEEN